MMIMMATNADAAQERHHKRCASYDGYWRKIHQEKKEKAEEIREEFSSQRSDEAKKEKRRKKKSRVLSSLGTIRSGDNRRLSSKAHPSQGLQEAEELGSLCDSTDEGEGGGDLQQFGDYIADLDAILGTGASALVVEGRDKEDAAVALKIIDTSALTEAEVEQVANEVGILGFLAKQDNMEELKSGVVLLHDTIEDNALLVLVFERLFGKDLVTVMSKFPDGMPEPRARSVFGRIAATLAILHDLNVAHLDIKLENMMVVTESEGTWDSTEGSNNGSNAGIARTVIKLLDFGYAERPEKGSLCSRFCGSLPYASPEIMERTPFNPFLADVWSLGIVLFVLLTNKFPFVGSDHLGVLDDINKKKKKKKEGRKMMDSYIQKALKDKSADCRSLMSSLLCVDPARRVLMSDVLKHPWVALGRPNGLPQRRQVAEKSTPVQHLTPQKLSRMTPLTPQEMRHVRRLDPEQQTLFFRKREIVLWKRHLAEQREHRTPKAPRRDSPLRRANSVDNTGVCQEHGCSSSQSSTSHYVGDAGDVDEELDTPRQRDELSLQLPRQAYSDEGLTPRADTMDELTNDEITPRYDPFSRYADRDSKFHRRNSIGEDIETAPNRLDTRRFARNDDTYTEYSGDEFSPQPSLDVDDFDGTCTEFTAGDVSPRDGYESDEALSRYYRPRSDTVTYTEDDCYSD